MKGLDPIKAHGHDMMSIRMLKMWGYSLYKPSEAVAQGVL